jgi:hypothetical protein
MNVSNLVDAAVVAELKLTMTQAQALDLASLRARPSRPAPAAIWLLARPWRSLPARKWPPRRSIN